MTVLFPDGLTVDVVVQVNSKGMTRADPNAFDLDLYVIHQAEFDRLYNIVMQHRPELLSRGKIFPDVEGQLTPDSRR